MLAARTFIRSAPRAARSRGLAIAVAPVRVGDAVPDLEVQIGWPPKPVALRSRLRDRRVVVVGLPGAFTPTWSEKQVPGYLAKQDALAAAGVDEVLVVCINDAAVMEAWAADQGCLDNAKRLSTRFVDSDRADGLVTFAADTHGALTEGLGMVMEPIKNLGGMRSLRYAAVFDNGFATHVAVSGLPGVDAAGDAFYANSCVDAILDVLAESPGADN